MVKIATKDLREKNKDELLKQLAEFKKELSQLRVAQHVSGTPAKVSKIRSMRKNVARVLTVMNQKERENVRKLYSKKGATKMPKELRSKLTKRRRLALKGAEKNAKTRRQIREASKFPRRVYAVKI